MKLNLQEILCSGLFTSNDDSNNPTVVPTDMVVVLLSEPRFDLSSIDS